MKPPPQPDCWRYELPGGFEALAGKTDADNDLLSLRVAAPNDLWFHVHGLPGSHVVLRHLDYSDVSFYEGSLTEWERQGRPLETGTR